MNDVLPPLSSFGVGRRWALSSLLHPNGRAQTAFRAHVRALEAQHDTPVLVTNEHRRQAQEILRRMATQKYADLTAHKKPSLVLSGGTEDEIRADIALIRARLGNHQSITVFADASYSEVLAEKLFDAGLGQRVNFASRNDNLILESDDANRPDMMDPRELSKLVAAMPESDRANFVVYIPGGIMIDTAQLTGLSNLAPLTFLFLNSDISGVPMPGYHLENLEILARFIALQA